MSLGNNIRQCDIFCHLFVVMICSHSSCSQYNEFWTWWIQITVNNVLLSSRGFCIIFKRNNLSDWSRARWFGIIGNLATLSIVKEIQYHRDGLIKEPPPVNFQFKGDSLGDSKSDLDQDQDDEASQICDTLFVTMKVSSVIYFNDMRILCVPCIYIFWGQ